MPTIFEVQPPCVRSRRPMLFQWPGQKKGGRRWSPLVDYNPPPTEGVRSVLDSNDKFLPNSDFFWLLDLDLLSERLAARLLDPSLCLSPAGRSIRRPVPKWVSFSSLLALFSIFWPSKKMFEICIEKIPKKVRKSLILVSQNPPQTLPKCLQKRSPKKHRFFRSFLP